MVIEIQIFYHIGTILPGPDESWSLQCLVILPYRTLTEDFQSTDPNNSTLFRVDICQVSTTKFNIIIFKYCNKMKIKNTCFHRTYNNMITVTILMSIVASLSSRTHSAVKTHLQSSTHSVLCGGSKKFYFSILTIYTHTKRK